MKKNNLKKIFLPLAACSGLALTTSAHAATLIFDDFSGSSGTNLVGTTADVGGAWTGASNAAMKADGSITASGEFDAYQAVTIAVGEVYTLSADITLDTGSLGFISIGFANTPGDGAGAIWDDANPYAWMYMNTTDHGIKRFTGINLGGEEDIGPTVFDTPVNLKVVLDTTNAANYEATWFIDGVDKGSAFIGAPSLTHVFINQHNSSTSGTVDNFTLTNTAIPEPSSVALLSLGGLVLLRRRRN
jgi:hypothetical protein